MYYIKTPMIEPMCIKQMNIPLRLFLFLSMENKVSKWTTKKSACHDVKGYVVAMTAVSVGQSQYSQHT